MGKTTLALQLVAYLLAADNFIGPS